MIERGGIEDFGGREEGRGEGCDARLTMDIKV
jgi:hypothetical protein